MREHQIPYKWVDIEQYKEGEQFVSQAKNGKRIIPTNVFEDGSILVEPSNAKLVAKLGLKMVASRSHYNLLDSPSLIWWSSLWLALVFIGSWASGY